MEAPLLTLLIGLAIACLAVGCKEEKQDTQPPAKISSTNSTTMLTREDLRKRLNKLAAIGIDNVPTTEKGAMCYYMPPPPNRTDYICPKCGERTIYTNQTTLDGEQPSQTIDGIALYNVNQLPAIRREIGALRSLGLDASLDESEFCGKCKPNVPRPLLCLSVKMTDCGEAFTYRGLSIDEVSTLKSFLQGDLGRKSKQEKIILKKQLPRLRELLGIQ